MATWKDAAVYGSIDSGTTLTVSYTTTTGADFLLVRLFRYSGDTVTSVKFNNVSMFFIGEKAEDNNNYVVGLYGLRAPSIGTYDVVFVKSGAGEPGALTVRSASGINQASDGASYRTPASTSGSGGGAGAITVNLTTVSGDLAFDVATSGGADLGAAGANQTADTASVAVALGYYRFATSTEDASGTTTTMSWAGTPTDAWGIIASALVPSAGSSAGRFGQYANQVISL